MITYANRDQLRKHEQARHHMKHECVGIFCLWGYSNVKHGPDDKGGQGRAGRRKRNGWRKGWVKDYLKHTGMTIAPQVGCYGREEKK